MSSVDRDVCFTFESGHRPTSKSDSIDKENARSIALALRLGSPVQREGVRLPAPFDDNMVDVYGQTRADWKARPR